MHGRGRDVLVQKALRWGRACPWLVLALVRACLSVSRGGLLFARGRGSQSSLVGRGRGILVRSQGVLVR